MTKTKTPRNLKNVMGEVCKKIGMTEAYEEYTTLKVWEQVVGVNIAKETEVEKINNGDLYVKVRNPSWRMELNFRKKELITRLNKVIGKEMIRSIIFK